MAERRMLHRKASVSTDLAALRTKHGGDALAFYLLMIAHLDRWGCVPDNPATLRAMVCPTWDDTTPAHVKTWVGWMVKRGMLVRVTGPAGDRGLRSPDFHDHQRGTDFTRESPSPFEPEEITTRWVRRDRAARPSRARRDDPPATSRQEDIEAIIRRDPGLSNRAIARRAGVSESTVRRLRQGASEGASQVRHGASPDARHDAPGDAAETPPMQGGQDQVETRSGPGRPEGKGNEVNPSPSPTPSRDAGESAAASPDPSPGAQAQPPEANGTRRLGALEHAAAHSPLLRAAVERTRRGAA